jgi:hypothetical protein
VSNRIDGMNAAALHQAQTIAAEARELSSPRRLSPDDMSKMFDAAKNLCHTLTRAPITAANSNQEAQTFALDFVRVFKSAGCTSDLELPIPGVTPDVQGIKIGVRNLKAIPSEVAMTAKIFSAGGIQYQISPLTAEFFPNDPFVIVVGAK